MFECLTGLKCFVQCLKYRDKILFIIIVVITVTVTVSVAIPNDAFPLGSHSLSFVHSTGLQLQRTDYYYICMYVVQLRKLKRIFFTQLDAIE